jgi:hypothetical protein
VLAKLVRPDQRVIDPDLRNRAAFIVIGHAVVIPEKPPTP